MLGVQSAPSQPGGTSKLMLSRQRDLLALWFALFPAWQLSQPRCYLTFKTTRRLNVCLPVPL